jgi:hypothetical protein
MKTIDFWQTIDEYNLQLNEEEILSMAYSFETDESFGDIVFSLVEFVTNEVPKK